MDEIADIFEGAAEFVEQLLSTQPGAVRDDAKLELYGLYKQATCGPCAITRPGIFDPRGRAKWDAWNKHGEKSQQQAQIEYVHIVGSVCQGWEQMLEKAGGESSSAGGGGGRMGPVFSTMAGETAGTEQGEEQELQGMHRAACSGDVAALECCASQGEDINSTAEGGCTALHFAADRGQIQAVRWLIQHGAALDAQDEDGLTALHYAAMCEQRQVYEELLAAGADTSIADYDGSTPAEMAPAAWCSS